VVGGRCRISLAPEEGEQDDDGQGNAQEPKQNAATKSHVSLSFFSRLIFHPAVANGAAQQSNFTDYQMIRIDEAPKVETVMVPSGDFWGGVGEPPVPPLAPALGNAIFAATGQRIRSLPLKNHNLAGI